MCVWNMLHAAHWKYRMQKLCKKSPSAHHRTTLLGYIFTTKACIDNRKKNLLNGNISSICLYNMVNFRPLTAEIHWRVWGTPANFNGFRVLASLLQRRRSTEVNLTVHNVWPFPALVYYMYAFLAAPSWPLTEFCQLQNYFASKSCILLYWQHYSTALEQRPSAKLCGVVLGMNYGTFIDGATYIRLGGHHVGHRPTS